LGCAELRHRLVQHPVRGILERRFHVGNRGALIDTLTLELLVRREQLRVAHGQC
jgi:hypothetical protein